MTISPGAIVRTLQTGLTAWVVQRLWPDNRARLISKAKADTGGETFTGRTVGLPDLILVKEAPTFLLGQQVKHDGVTLEVLRDNGAEVEFVVPASRFRHSTGTVLKIPSGNRTTIHKSELVLSIL